MNKKRILSLSILTAMLLGQLASCGGTSSSNDTTDTQPTDTTEPVVQSEYVKPDVNYNNETVTIACFNLDYAYAIAQYTMINHEENGDTLNDAIYQMTRQVEEDLGVKLEIFELLREERFEPERLTKSMYAGDNEIQIAFPLTSGLTKILAEPEILVDLNTVPTLDLSHTWWDQKSVDEYEIRGVQYTAVGDLCFFAKGAPVMTFFNKQLLEDNKLEDPYTLVKEGKWTVDKMMELGLLVANDLDGKYNEKEDIFGFIGQSDTLKSIMTGSNLRYIDRDKDDNISINFDMEKAAVLVEKLVPFLGTKSTTLLADDFYGKYTNPDPFEGLLQPTFMENRGLFFSNQLLMALDFRAMDADFGILPMPKYDETQENYYCSSSGAWTECVMIPTTNPNLEQAGHILEAMGYYSQQYVTPAFIESTIYSKSIRDEESGEMVQLILDNLKYDIVDLFDWGGLGNMFCQLIWSDSTDLASKYASVEPVMQEAINKTMEALGN